MSRDLSDLSDEYSFTDLLDEREARLEHELQRAHAERDERLADDQRAQLSWGEAKDKYERDEDL